MAAETNGTSHSPCSCILYLHFAAQPVDKASWYFGNSANNQRQRKARALGGFDCRLFARQRVISNFLKGFWTKTKGEKERHLSLNSFSCFLVYTNKARPGIHTLVMTNESIRNAETVMLISSENELLLPARFRHYTFLIKLKHREIHHGLQNKSNFNISDGASPTHHSETVNNLHLQTAFLVIVTTQSIKAKF